MRTQQGQTNDDQLLMRLAGKDDKDPLLTWRNNPNVVPFTRTQAAISPEEHAHWFEKRLHDLNTEPILIFTLSGARIGMTRLDLIDPASKGYEISILVDESYQNAGFGKRMLLQTCELAMNEFSATFIRADIHEENRASVKLFTNLGFTKKSKHNDAFSSYEFVG